MSSVKSQKHYDLEKFLEPCDFPTEPEDQIEKVKLLMVKLKPTNNQCSITFAIHEEHKNSIYEIAHDWFDTHNPFESGFIVHQIKLLIKFYSKKVFIITISYPCLCDLSQCSKNEREIVIKYLKLWGLIEEY
jgi:hypothetical protein